MCADFVWICIKLLFYGLLDYHVYFEELQRVYEGHVCAIIILNI